MSIKYKFHFNMNRRKLNGAECILKALCETGQRANDEKPGSFLMEIMRSIFR